MEEVKVIIVGAGPAGLATSACLNRLSIPNIVLEREDCYASLWKKRAYDRLKLHLAKEFCELPHMPFPPDAPVFIPRNEFITYLDQYVTHLGISPRCCRSVESAYYDESSEKWCIKVKNGKLNVYEMYIATFLVVATGENSEGCIPNLPGLDSFDGEFIHSSKYENGKKFWGKDVLVVGCGNSGMEIAYDLSNLDVKTSIVARSPVHVLTKAIVHLGMRLLKFLPWELVDVIVTLLSRFKHGDLSAFGIPKPTKGPFYLKATTGRTPTIDVGAVEKIKRNEIQVFPSIERIEGKKIKFVNGRISEFDVIIFATGYKSTVRRWLTGGYDLFDESGMTKLRFSSHWKGKNGLYCAGFSRKGLFGISEDAVNIAGDINLVLKSE